MWQIKTEDDSIPFDAVKIFKREGYLFEFKYYHDMNLYALHVMNSRSHVVLRLGCLRVGWLIEKNIKKVLSVLRSVPPVPDKNFKFLRRTIRGGYIDYYGD